MHKLPQWDSLKDEFKKELLFKGLRSIVQNSFLRKHMSTMGKMPVAVEKLIAKYQVERTQDKKNRMSTPPG
jgi:hypothetical protein